MTRFMMCLCGVTAVIILSAALSSSKGSSEPATATQFVASLEKEAAEEKLFGKNAREESTQALAAINSQGTLSHRNIQVTVWVENGGTEKLYGTFFLSRLLMPHDSILRDISEKKVKVVKVEFGFKDGIFKPMQYKVKKAAAGKYMLFAAIVWDSNNEPSIVMEEEEA